MAIDYTLEIESSGKFYAKSKASGIQTGNREALDSFGFRGGDIVGADLAITEVSVGIIDVPVAGYELSLATLTNPEDEADYEPLPGSSPPTKKLMYIWARNTDETNSVTITIPAANGLAGLGWAANAHVARLDPHPGGKWEQIWKTGSSALNTGVNDLLRFVASGGTPRVELRCGFG